MLRSAQLTLDLLFTISLHCPTGIFIARFYGFLFIYLVSRQYCNILRFIFKFFFCWHMRVVTKKLFVVGSYLLRTVLGHAWNWHCYFMSECYWSAKIRQWTLYVSPCYHQNIFIIVPQNQVSLFFKKSCFSPKNFLKGQCHPGNLQYLTNSKQTILSVIS